MRILDFTFALIEKFSPMSTTDRAELRNDAANDYIEIKKNVIGEDKKPIKKPAEMNIKEKVVFYSEQWTVRLLLALAFIWVQPIIQNYMNPEVSDDFDDDGDD